VVRLFRINAKKIMLRSMGECLMLRTIAVGSCVSIQGLVVGHLADGKLMVKVDEKTFVGYPVAPVRAA